MLLNGSNPDFVFDVIDLVFKFVAIPLTLLLTWIAHQQRSMFDMIDKVYAVCHVLHDQVGRNWRISHLFCIDDLLYWDVRRRVELEAKDGLPAEIEPGQLIQDERNFAVRIFIAYEQVYYQQTQCGWLHAKRGRYLGEMLEYFTKRLLQNPRLLAFLAADPTGRQLHLEPASTADLIKRLGAMDSWMARADFNGPFGYDPRSIRRDYRP